MRRSPRLAEVGVGLSCAEMKDELCRDFCRTGLRHRCERQNARRSPAVGAERKRPCRGPGGACGVGAEATSRRCDLGIGRTLAARPLLRRRLTVFRHVEANDGTGHPAHHAGLFAGDTRMTARPAIPPKCKSSATASTNPLALPAIHTVVADALRVASADAGNPHLSRASRCQDAFDSKKRNPVHG